MRPAVTTRRANLRSVFGLSFGELCVLLIVAVVVLGPKELPRYLRKAGQFAGRMRRLAYEMREKSGIDEVLRTEGIDRDIAEIRKLARGEIGGVVAAVRSTTDADAARHRAPATRRHGAPTRPAPSPPSALRRRRSCPSASPIVVDREREYPREGADSYGALPDTAIVYEGSLPASPLAGDALYTRGEAGMTAAAPAPAPPPSRVRRRPTPERDVRMTIWEHLEELRRRIIKAAIGVLVGDRSSRGASGSSSSRGSSSRTSTPGWSSSTSRSSSRRSPRPTPSSATSSSR